MKTKEEIKIEYLRLRNVYLGMVGSLYPSIVYKELLQLVEEYHNNPDRTDYWGDLPEINSPLPSGHIF